MYIENITPKIIPTIVAKKPIRNPVKKKDLIIDFFDKPNDFRIAISFVLFFIRIVSPEIILNAATMIIKVNDNCIVISVDASVNVYLTGNFRNEVDFDPGEGITNLNSRGEEDIFFSKLYALNKF